MKTAGNHKPTGFAAPGLLVTCALCRAAAAQDQGVAPTAPFVVCTAPANFSTTQLYGLWQLALWTDGGSSDRPASTGTLQFELTSGRLRQRRLPVHLGLRRLFPCQRLAEHVLSRRVLSGALGSPRACGLRSCSLLHRGLPGGVLPCQPLHRLQGGLRRCCLHALGLLSRELLQRFAQDPRGHGLRRWQRRRNCGLRVRGRRTFAAVGGAGESRRRTLRSDRFSGRVPSQRRFSNSDLRMGLRWCGCAEVAAVAAAGGACCTALGAGSAALTSAGTGFR